MTPGWKGGGKAVEADFVMIAAALMIMVASLRKNRKPTRSGKMSNLIGVGMVFLVILGLIGLFADVFLGIGYFIWYLYKEMRPRRPVSQEGEKK